MGPTVKIIVAAESPSCIPQYATEHAAGMDLKAFEACTLEPGERKAVATGLRIAIPVGYEGQVRPRSGLALKHGLSIPNAPGTIDADYRGELKVILINLGAEPVTVGVGDRIAQLVICPVCKAEWIPAIELPDSERGTGGFGSTGS